MQLMHIQAKLTRTSGLAQQLPTVTQMSSIGQADLKVRPLAAGTRRSLILQLLLFLFLAGLGGLGGGDDLVGLELRDVVVVAGLHGERATALGHGS